MPLYRYAEVLKINLAPQAARLITFCVLCVSIILLLTVTAGSLDTLKSLSLLRLISDPRWDPAASGGGLYNIPVLLAGTISVALLALFFAVPLGCGSAVAIEFYLSGFIRSLVYTVVTLLSGIPSVVLGLWGLETIVPMIAKMHTPGSGLLAASCVLSIMIFPVIAFSAVTALKEARKRYAPGGLALGLGKSSLILAVLLPAARASILSGIMLALMRALGETMIILMLAGNVAVFPDSVFSPVRTLTSTIALEMGYAYGTHQNALYLLGLILITGVVIISLLTRLLAKGDNQ
ncbi:MAG: ABC transporter permease subunit [Candidatus Dadabacteria bacterium]|nr:MAG: ABC transporter permease subunit [Candidatus Dadabacteria bacterium]